MKIIEVFKTNVHSIDEALSLVALIQCAFLEVKANFDLDDCDRILRVEGCMEVIGKIPLFMKEKGYECFALPD
ncbi:hypothetical protein [Aquiflexum gelatinilyticum]|uniref:hypothetical protein n=1 Tax=Aquiflexum gelatinilyticum TaxID=2961943 RepID=UPI002166FA94|nr:hypothetical protein [Aquiflexum gelatinilyticum]MCS4434585.1 hypothetical protein [Aquiflexum gelatinilyticum]